jgi:hypothetical protein
MHSKEINRAWIDTYLLQIGIKLCLNIYTQDVSSEFHCIWVDL